MRKIDEKQNGEAKSPGGKARGGRSPGGKPRGGKGRVMFFLLRVAFWLCVVLVLLPTGKSQDTSSTSQVGPGEALTAASAAISDVRHFCERQPDACAVGGQAAVSLGHRAKDGAKMIYDFLSEKLAPQNTGSISGARTSRPAASPAASSQHTLTPTDLTPAWRGPQSRPDAAPQRQT